MRIVKIVLGALALLFALGGVYWQLLPSERRTAFAIPSSKGTGTAAKTTEATATAQTSPQMSFGDKRPLVTSTASDAPGAPSAPSFKDGRLAAPAAEPAATTIPAPGSPSFKDGRLATTPGSEPVAADTAGGSPSFKDGRLATGGVAEPAPAPSFRDGRIATEATPSFRDTRIGPAFSDDRPLQTPSFRDKRTIEAPTFADDRPVQPAPSFRDERGVGAPSFRDERTLGPGADDGDGAPQVVALAPALKLDRANCPLPELSGEPLDGGRMNLRAHAACQANQTIRITYGGAELIRTLDASGNLDFTLDCFAGVSSAVEVRFADGTKKSIPAVAYEFDKISKIAVIWRAAVNLDLHVFEYAARVSQPGHLWAKSASTLAAARSLARAEHRGHGFLSSVDSEENPGDKIEVYTFLHDDEQISGAIGLALDYETRGETPQGATCGTGALAEVDFQVVVLPRGGNPARQSGVLTRVDCGTKLTADTRFSQSALPSLRIRK